MEKQTVYRRTSLERIQSPEQLNDYLRVTNPAVWVLMGAVIILLAGFIIWGSFTYIGSFVDGSGRVESGTMTILFSDEKTARNVKEGMTVKTGDTESTIRNVGYGKDGKLFATADSSLNDGVYEVQVCYRQSQIMKLLFN